LTGQGVELFQQYVKGFDDFKYKNDLCRQLQMALKDKVTVESNTANVIKKLQASGCWVFGLTARYSEMAVSTDAQLAALDINLGASSPFPPETLYDDDTDAMYSNGVIYCNNLSKGTILDRFLSHITFRPTLALLAEEAKADALSHLPGAFIFVDDQREHVDSFGSQLQTLRTLNIPLICYHYKREIVKSLPSKEDVEQTLILQMQTFVDRRVVLSNEHARTILAEKKKGLH